MGVFVGLVLLLGVAAGLAVSGVLIAMAVVFARRLARSRRNVWPVFSFAVLLWLAAAILAMLNFPYAAIEPGGDFMPVLRNAFAGGLGYCAGPGVAAVLAMMTARICPARPAGL